jgi:8-oxo-dGTP diphosphatase
MKKYCYDYPMPAVTTDCIVIKNTTPSKVLLIKRKYDPYEGKWALPGGFVEIDEELDAGAHRELEEETGLQNIALTQFKTFGKPGRDPRGRTISVVYFGYAESQATVKAGDDAHQTGWFDIHQLPPLAFDHDLIIEEFLKNLK